jgi:hypothetical protein
MTEASKRARPFAARGRLFLLSTVYVVVTVLVYAFAAVVLYGHCNENNPATVCEPFDHRIIDTGSILLTLISAGIVAVAGGAASVWRRPAIVNAVFLLIVAVGVAIVATVLAISS